MRNTRGKEEIEFLNNVEKKRYEYYDQKQRKY